MNGFTSWSLSLLDRRANRNTDFSAYRRCDAFSRRGAGVAAMTKVLVSHAAFHHWLFCGWALAFVLLALLPATIAHALPIFARQTGQSCVACHAGGQFPELTPYGRMFKLTGYTLGERTIPIAAMAIGDLSQTRVNTDSSGNTINTKNGLPIFDFASIFLAGKITDKIGAFTQFTYTNYDHQNGTTNKWEGHWASDNTDFRFVDRIMGEANDLILGVTLHNNPTVQDVWNSAPAWGYPYISSTISPVAKIPNLPVIEGSLATQVAGIGGYLYWNKTVYAELTAYSTADGIWSFMSHGNREGNAAHPQIYLRGYNPYARIALTREWGPHSAMVGAFLLNVNIYPNDSNQFPIFTQGVTRFRDYGVDAQYEYLLEPHTITAQARYVLENVHDPNNLVLGDSTSGNLNSLRIKASYVYQAKYGFSLSFFNTTGGPDSTAYAASANFHPNTQGWTPEIFWIPNQRIRVGIQYTHYTKFLGATSNYDGAGRNARDNDTLFIYLWAASW
ncbi:cytochrome C [Paraburkholderia sp. CNPSo 3272]|uniref:cytochrome C n=1 Tax=Paraburkholderia sp. CNPSo 3272 TaxID=2940931 RepID=UPI0020B6EECA|nr:cytochrome C [Paraburkholderia sp. CNPSo 3272]MCP3726442.1 cytochrome C [Paraburkholderia sp. CNPSo 3272]